MFLQARGKLSKEAFLAVVRQAAQVMAREPNLIRISGRVVMFGDIHGHFDDLCDILTRQRFGTTNKKFLFLGDYVDRGAFGPEVIALLFAMKIRFPNQVHLLRGNHETRECTEDYNFREQMIVKYDEETYEAVIDAFYQLPLAAIVNGEYLCLHGGVSSRLNRIEQIDELERRQECTYDASLFNDILWADPIKSRKAQHTKEEENVDRGLSVKFGWPVLKPLLERNQLKTLVRAHQQKDMGYKLHLWAGKDEEGVDRDPPCITIFSAPNYSNHQNPGSILITGDANKKARVLVYD